MKANIKLGNKLEAKTGQKSVDMLTGKSVVKKPGTVVPTSLKYGGKSC
jgi:hypothetical protein